MTAVEPIWVAGLDGCPGGWIAVLRDVAGDLAPRCLLLSEFAAITEVPERPAIIAVDIPIGLPDHVGSGGRGCDAAARKVIGARQSSIFSVPARLAVMELEYSRACTVAAANSSPSRKVSKQCFYLFPKIREVDTWIESNGKERVFECHPEVAFWAMNDQRPLVEPKKVKSRPYEPGLALRRSLLERHGYPPPFLRNTPWKQKDAAADDLLDACATAWTAVRVYRGEAIAFPDNPQVDGHGLPMAIWA